MGKSFFFICLSLLTLFVWAGCSKDSATPVDPFTESGVKEYTYKILDTYPHDDDAFTQGLVYNEGYIYEGTGLYGHSSLRQVELQSGKIIQQKNLSRKYFGEGITLLNNKIYQITWLEKKGFIYGMNDFDSLGTFSYDHEGWGLTHNGKDLILSDGSSVIRFLNAETFELLKMIEVILKGEPLKNLNELEYIEGMIYANLWQTDWIAIIDPQDGRVVGRIDLTGLLDESERTLYTDVLNGIAYDADRKGFFVTGKFWPKIFQIELVPR